MKVSSTPAYTFVPFDLKVRIETREEMIKLHQLLGHCGFLPRDTMAMDILDALRAELEKNGAA